MTASLESVIRDDFLAWSGGFPPESPQQTFVYVETAMPNDCDPSEAANVLKVWMSESEHGND